MRRGLIARSPVELPDAVLDTRLAKLRTAMAGLDAVMVYTNHTQPAAVSWLTGFVPYWSEALLVVPRARLPVLVVALTFRVKPWIERTSRVAEVIHTPRIGLEAARLVAAAKPDAAVGIVDFDQLGSGIADDLREGGPHLSLSDAGDMFAVLRGSADPAELMLAVRAAAIADRALSVMPPRAAGIGAILGSIEGEARRLGAEEIYLAAAPDLASDTKLRRIEGEPQLGERFALRASVAYKGAWVRRVITVEPGAEQRSERAHAAFAAAAAQLPDASGFAPFKSFLVEGCRTAQPLEALMGSRIDEPRPPAPGAVVSVEAVLAIDEKEILIGAPVLVGAPGSSVTLDFAELFR
jgi:hypothetical protein